MSTITRANYAAEELRRALVVEFFPGAAPGTEDFGAVAMTYLVTTLR